MEVVSPLSGIYKFVKPGEAVYLTPSEKNTL
jgi:hypothetical protein